MAWLLLRQDGQVVNHERVHWLRQGAGVPGFAGFAVGRTIWWDPLRQWIAGEAGPELAARAIADRFMRMVAAYESAATHVEPA